MNKDLISIVVNGNSYRLEPGDSVGIDAIDATDRQRLMELLVAIKQQQEQRDAIVQRRLQQTRSAKPAVGPAIAKGAVIDRGADQRAMSAAEVDALMAQLVIEEKKNTKPGLTRKRLYQWIVYSVIAIIVLIVIS